MRKPRILWSNEASFLNTGFSVYGMEVIRSLFDTGKYELAELASYGTDEDPRRHELPWKYYGNEFSRNASGQAANPHEEAQYKSKPTNQFGEWRFEQVCLDFKPDIVVNIRDWWMLEYEERSVFRPFFNWCIMPTVDGAPQDEQWIATYLNADNVTCYSDWGLDVLNIQGGGKIKTRVSTPPSADLDIFKPVKDRKAHRKALGVTEDINIIGTVMRNQKRKLYPDLCAAFRKFLNTTSPELGKKTFLYLHTSYPDIGWDIPRLIKEHGIGHKTIVTYVCKDKNCGTAFPGFFQGALTTCPRCGQASAGMPNTGQGVSREVLANIINLFDIYVQYSICEGFGMPQVEAAACGVPVMAVDYSAMADVVRKVEGFPIKVQRYYRESDTHCYRALPDNDDAIRIWNSFFRMPSSKRQDLRFKARKAVEYHYTWKDTVKKWENIFDNIELKDLSTTWNSPPRIHVPPTEMPGNMPNEALVRWGINNVLAMPELADSYFAMRMTRDLNYKATIDQFGGFSINEESLLGARARYKTFSQRDAIQKMIELRNHYNHWEKIRSEQNKV